MSRAEVKKRAERIGKRIQQLVCTGYVLVLLLHVLGIVVTKGFRFPSYK